MPANNVNGKNFNRDVWLQELAAKMNQKQAQQHLTAGAPKVGLDEQQIQQIGTKSNGKEMAQAIQSLLKASAPSGAQQQQQGGGAQGTQGSRGAQGGQSAGGAGRGGCSGGCCGRTGGCGGRGLNGCNGNSNCCPPNRNNAPSPVNKPSISPELKKQLQSWLDKGGDVKKMPQDLKDSLKKEGVTVKEATDAVKEDAKTSESDKVEKTSETEGAGKEGGPIGAPSVEKAEKTDEKTPPVGETQGATSPAPDAGPTPPTAPAPVEAPAPPAAAPPAAVQG